MSSRHPWIGAAETSRLLGVSRTTLYAYVSRGFIRSQPRPGSTRERIYARDDVERLRQRTEERRDPDKARARALQWGLPILESAITLIDGRRLYYRGHDAVDLSRSRSLADVASLIWTGSFDSNELTRQPWPNLGESSDQPFVARAQTALAATAPRDPAALDLRTPNVVLTGWRILQLLTAVAARSKNGGPTAEETLARAWRLRGRSVDAIRAALILCADHELNVSSFTARCVASAGSHPYAVVIAGLAALEGPRHGGASARAEAMLTSLRHARRVDAAIAERLRRGEHLDGFGHPLYRHGDPRASALLDLLKEYWGKSAELAFVVAVARAASAATGEQPNLDFALAALSRVLRLPPEAPLMLFAIGRSIGWIGHAIEQYETNQLIRPRAKYVGVAPVASGSSRTSA
jgi:citrate synthase